MEFIFGYGLLFVGPWIMGIVYVIKLATRSSAKISDNELVKGLWQRLENLPRVEDKKKVIDAMNIFSIEQMPYPENVENQQAPSPIPPVQPNIHVSEIGESINITGIKQTEYPTAQETPKYQPVEHKSIMESLENINILLYLGAFLVVVSAGIFVGFNYQLLSNNTKVFFIFAFAMIFYFCGLGLYRLTVKLTPAGLTFNTIGMIIFPLVGIAYWRFITEGQNGKEIWFVTSILTLIMYIISLLVIKKSFVAYFLTFTALSLFESSISMFSFPIYYLFWGMAVFSLISNYLSRRVKDNYGIMYSLDYTSQFVLPIALLCSLGAIFSNGLQQAGINLLIGFVFYLLFAFMESKESIKKISFALAVGLAYIGSAFIAYDSTKDIAIVGWTIFTCSAIASLFILLTTKYLKKDYQADALIAYSSVGSLLAALFVYETSKLILLIVGLALIINLVNYTIKKNSSSFTFTALSLMLLPAVYFGLVSEKASDNYMLVMSYVLIGVLAQTIKAGFNTLKVEYKDILIVTLTVSFIVAISVALAGENKTTLFATLAFISFYGYLLSFMEYKDVYTSVATGFLFFTILAFSRLANMTASNLTLLITGIGLVIYCLNYCYRDNRKFIFQMSSITFLIISTIYGFFALELNLVAILSFFILGAVLYYFGHESQEKYLRYAAGAILIGATETLMGYWKIEELHYYMLLWSFYFGGLGYIQFTEEKKTNCDYLVVIALAFQTLPLFFQAHGPKEHFYGLILGIESIIILLTGMIMKYNLVKYWGSATLVIVVLYQLKDELLALPKWLIIGVIGLLFLFGAMYMLYRRQDHEDISPPKM